MVLELLQASRSSQKTSANLIRGQPSIKIGYSFLKFGRTGVGPVHGLKIPLFTKSSLRREHWFPLESRDFCTVLAETAAGTGARKRVHY
jgi:hypothetical protein